MASIVKKLLRISPYLFGLGIGLELVMTFGLVFALTFFYDSETVAYLVERNNGVLLGITVGVYIVWLYVIRKYLASLWEIPLTVSL